MALTQRNGTNPRIHVEDRAASPTRALLRNHWLVRHGAKVVLGLLLTGVVALLLLVSGLRDTVRDQGHATEQVAPLKERVRKVERAIDKMGENVRWIRREMERGR